MKDYELASGQIINYDKSEITVSAGVHHTKAIALASILGMRMIDKHSKYLGVPIAWGRSKKEIVYRIVDRVTKKWSGWKENFLSNAGKEILLKLVIKVIPTYIMGLYKFPAHNIQRLKSIMAKFWWGSSLH